jgi:hypothetical protein
MDWGWLCSGREAIIEDAHPIVADALMPRPRASPVRGSQERGEVAGGAVVLELGTVGGIEPGTIVIGERRGSSSPWISFMRLGSVAQPRDGSAAALEVRVGCVGGDIHRVIVVEVILVDGVLIIAVISRVAIVLGDAIGGMLVSTVGGGVTVVVSDGGIAINIPILVAVGTVILMGVGIGSLLIPVAAGVLCRVVIAVGVSGTICVVRDTVGIGSGIGSGSGSGSGECAISTAISTSTSSSRISIRPSSVATRGVSGVGSSGTARGG